jgi:hypothetical protein
VKRSEKEKKIIKWSKQERNGTKTEREMERVGAK